MFGLEILRIEMVSLQRTTVALVVVAALITVVTFFIEPVAFRSIDVPPSSLLPAFIFLSFWDALAFGVGVALLVYLAINYSKWPRTIRTPLLLVFFVALWFTLLNWVHDGLHESGAAPPNFQLLAVVEYVFHFPWLIFAAILVIAVRQLTRAYVTK